MHGLCENGRDHVRSVQALSANPELESARPRQPVEKATLVPLLSVRGLDASDDLQAVQHRGYVRLPESGVTAYLDVLDR